MKPVDACNLSHLERENSLQSSIENIRDKIISRGDLPYVSVDRQLKLLEDLSQSDFGKFLIERGGLNGYWTHCLIKKNRLHIKDESSFPHSFVEEFLVNQAPTALATQQRFEIFKTEIQKHIKDGIHFASVPCGLMADFLDLDFTNISDFNLIGVDIDPESIAFAKELAQEKDLLNHCNFIEKDAWNLNIYNQFDLVTSNGLSIYEADENRVVDLYKEFFKSLKPGGVSDYQLFNTTSSSRPPN